MSLGQLDESTASVARAIFRKWPEWREFAVMDGEPARLRLHVPNPPGSRLDSPLSIWADGDEVTVGMDTYHTHFPWPCEPDELAVELTDPIGFIQLLIEEQRAVLTHLRGDIFSMSSILNLADYQAGRFRERSSSSVDGYRVRSWRGTLDLDGRFDE